MDYNNMLKEFEKLSGIYSVGIIENKDPQKIYISEDSSQEFQNYIDDLTHFLPKKVLDLSINDFQFEGASKRIICYSEQNVFLILFADTKLNEELILSKINAFLNKVLLES